jgi:hypothetical protein
MYIVNRSQLITKLHLDQLPGLKVILRKYDRCGSGSTLQLNLYFELFDVAHGVIIYCKDLGEE